MHTHKRVTTLLDFVRDCLGGWHQKGKINLDLLQQEIVSGSGISWAICKSAHHQRQITMLSLSFTGLQCFDTVGCVAVVIIAAGRVTSVMSVIYGGGPGLP